MTTNTRDAQFQIIADQLTVGQTIVEPITGTRCGTVAEVETDYDTETVTVTLTGECGDVIEPFVVPTSSPVTVI